MVMDESIIYWIELSDYDLATASAMLDTARYLYVGFMCHQVIEKILKASFVKTKEGDPPHTHNLSYLARKAGLLENLTAAQKDFLDLLEPLNVEARYPSQKEYLLRSLTKEKCAYILEQTKELQAWVKTKLSTN